jgi:MSHA biogenesis protein MshI
MRGWVAVAPIGRHAHAAHVAWPVQDGALPQLRWACELDWADPACGLRQLHRQHQLTQSPCLAVLERQHYQLLPLDAPEVPREAWRDAVRWKLRDMVDFPVDDAGIDLLEIPSDTSQRGRIGLLVAAAPQQAMQTLVHAADEAGLSWQALDVAETALRNISLLCIGTQAGADGLGQAQALLGLGETHSWLVVTAHGELLLSRQLELTHAQIVQPTDETDRGLWDRVALELQRTLDHCDRLFSRVSLGRLLVGPLGRPARAPDEPAATTPEDEPDPAAAFMAYLRELVYPPVQGFDLADLIDLSAVPALQADLAAQSRYLVAIGAALRPAEPAAAAAALAARREPGHATAVLP